MALVFSVLMVLSGCLPAEDKPSTDSPVDDTGAPGDTADSAAPAVPTVRLTSPEGDVYTSTPLTWEVSGLTLSADIGGAAVEGEGHVHVWVDGALVGESAEAAFVFPEGTLTGGAHAVEVRLAGNDHTELGPTDAAELRVLVPTLSITSPAKGARLTSRGFQLQVATSDFRFSPDVGGADVIGQGHLLLYIDARYYGTVTDPDDAWFMHVGDGEHVIVAELVNNDQSSLSPPVTATLGVIMEDNASDVQLGDGFIEDPHDSATMKLGLFAEGFQLEPDVSGTQPNADRIGHAHLYVDGVRVAETGESFTWLRHLSPGPHRLMAALAARDHTEVGARDVRDVEVVADRPDVVVRSPADGGAVASSMTLQVDTENFTLRDAVDAAPVDDEGFVQVFVDGVEWAIGTSGEIPLEGLPPAAHRVEVWLYGNDRVPLDPPVGDWVTVQVE